MLLKVSLSVTIGGLAAFKGRQGVKVGGFVYSVCNVLEKGHKDHVGSCRGPDTGMLVTREGGVLCVCVGVFHGHWVSGGQRFCAGCIICCCFGNGNASCPYLHHVGGGYLLGLAVWRERSSATNNRTQCGPEKCVLVYLERGCQSS